MLGVPALLFQNPTEMQSSIMKDLVISIVFLSLVAILGVNANPVDWSQFRGPNGSGLAEKCGELPIEFGPVKNMIWKTKIPLGYSSPVLTEKQIFITAYEEYNFSALGITIYKQQKLYVLALDRWTGRILWRQEVPANRRENLRNVNSPASPSPVTDGQNVYAFFTDFGLIAFTSGGKELWRLPLGPFNNFYGLGASPILLEDKLLMNCDQDTGSFLVAVDKLSGRVRWRVDRSEFSRGFATPIVYRPPVGTTQILVSGSFQLTSYSAETGKKLWWLGGLSWEMKSTPVMSREMIFVSGRAHGSDEGKQEIIPSFEEVLKREDVNRDSKLSLEEISDDRIRKEWDFIDLDRDGFISGRDWHFYQLRSSATNSVTAFRLGSEGDETQRCLVWRYSKTVPRVPSPLLYKNIIYLMKEGGILTALDAGNGVVLKQARLEQAPGNYYASPVEADDKIYTVSNEGKVSVIRPGKNWDVIATNDLGDECYATPAIADGRLYIRTKGELYCFGKK